MVEQVEKPENIRVRFRIDTTTDKLSLILLGVHNIIGNIVVVEEITYLDLPTLGEQWVEQQQQLLDESE